jgi:DNA-binding SARP family transcriptional activator
VDGTVVVDEHRFRGRQGRLAFVYLATERSRPIPREELANVLWPDEMAPTWDTSMNSLVSKLRSLFSSGSLQGRGLDLVSGSGQYRLQLPPDGWIDFEAAASAVDEAESALRVGEPQRILGPATVAMNICRRPFLSGVAGDWVDIQRRKLERQLVRALDCLSHMGLALDEPNVAVERSIEAVGLDPFRERSYQLLMRAHMANGNGAEALSTYHRPRKILEDDLATSPSAETEALYLELLR